MEHIVRFFTEDIFYGVIHVEVTVQSREDDDSEFHASTPISIR